MSGATLSFLLCICLYVLEHIQANVMYSADNLAVTDSAKVKDVCETYPGYTGSTEEPGWTWALTTEKLTKISDEIQVRKYKDAWNRRVLVTENFEAKSGANQFLCSVEFSVELRYVKAGTHAAWSVVSLTNEKGTLDLFGEEGVGMMWRLMEAGNDIPQVLGAGMPFPTQDWTNYTVCVAYTAMTFHPVKDGQNPFVQYDYNFVPGFLQHKGDLYFTPGPGQQAGADTIDPAEMYIRNIGYPVDNGIQKVSCQSNVQVQVTLCHTPPSRMALVFAYQLEDSKTLRYKSTEARNVTSLMIRFDVEPFDPAKLQKVVLSGEIMDKDKFDWLCFAKVEIIARDSSFEPTVVFESVGIYQTNGFPWQKNVIRHFTSGDEYERTSTYKPVEIYPQIGHTELHIAFKYCAMQGSGDTNSIFVMRALVVDALSNQFEYTDWVSLNLTYYVHSPGDLRDKIYWSLDKPVLKVIDIEMNMQSGDSPICISEVFVNDKPVNHTSASWLAPKDWRSRYKGENLTYCAWGCQPSLDLILTYGVCNITTVNVREIENVEPTHDQKSHVGSGGVCNNYNRFNAIECQVSRDFTIDTSVDTTLNTGSEFSFSLAHSSSNWSENTWSKEHSVGFEKGPFEFGHSKGQSSSSGSSQENTQESSSTYSTDAGIGHSVETSQTITCAATGKVPAGMSTEYILTVTVEHGTLNYYSDIKLTMCPEMWADGTDANDKSNYRMLYDIETATTAVQMPECQVTFNAPKPLGNTMSCANEQAEAVWNDLERYVSCNETHSDLYDGCACDAMNSLTSSSCICVEQDGTPIGGTLTFVKDGDSWQDTCHAMACENSKY